MNDKYKPTNFLIFITFIVFFVIGHNFIRYYIEKDYPVQAFSMCDATVHNCFNADPDIADPTFQTGPYSKVNITARSAPSCLDEHSCNDFTCKDISGFCKVLYCSNDIKEEGESCSSQ
jgi:hypothetical protein